MKSVLKHAIVSILTIEARILLRRTKPTIIAVTGNVGKTTTKDAIYAVLKDHTHCRKSEKSFNSELGVPLTILGLANAWSDPLSWFKNIVDGFMIAMMPHGYPDVLVLEMGVDRPGDMKRFARWIKPDVVVLTRLPDVPVHVEYFETPEAVIAEKLELVKALKPDGVFVYNNDDEKVRHTAAHMSNQTIGYGRYAPTDFAATQDVIRYENGVPVGLSFTLTHGHEAVTVEIDGAVGVQHAYTAAAAAAVGSIFAVPLVSIVAAMHAYVPPPGRMRLIQGVNESVILDDTYNSSPVAAERALLTLKEVKGATRRIAVLGDMLELGRFSVDAHRSVGELALKSADMLVTVGVRARGIAERALEAGMNAAQVHSFDDAAEAAEKLRALVASGDVILVKGSQGVRLERVVVSLMANPEKASELLVRQSQTWKQR
jgi:UDP-N-acetylmuramoyl-tripeptide--D-alanyl-D-alanine ligase